VTITADSRWRTLGNVSRERWRQQLETAGSPIAAEWETAYEAAYPHTALALAMMEVESRHATRFNRNDSRNKNPLNLRPPGQDGYLAFATYADAIRAWRDRITDPTYRGGVYDKTVSILELVERYAPGFDNNDPSAYAAIVAARVTAWLSTESGAPERNDGGNAQMSAPVIYDLMRDYARFGISQEDAATVRGYRFENRTWGGVKGSADYLLFHIQDGTTPSSLDWWANGYVNGVKVTASSHYMVQRDGSILVVIPEQHAAWTNGDDNRPTPAGAPLVALPGNTNLWTITIEAEGRPSDPPTNYPAQMDALEWLACDIMARNPNCAKRGHQLRHADVNSVTRPNCPGAYYLPIMARIADAIEDGAPVSPAPIWWTPGDDVGIVVRPSDDYMANAMLVQTYATTKRDVPVYDQIGGTKIAEIAKGKPAIVGGTARGRDARGAAWYFVKVEGGYGRARGSSFLDRLPLP